MKDDDGIHKYEVSCCLLCGNEGLLLYNNLQDRLFGAPGIWTLKQCPRCRLVWLDPQPTPENIGKLYSNYFTHQTIETTNPNRQKRLRKAVKGSILQYDYGYQIDGSNKVMGSVLGRIGFLREIVGRSVRWLEACERGHLLDVGCGNGSFLDMMQQLGWEVVGVDPDGEAVSTARRIFGLKVFQGSLDDVKFPDNHFDAITMNHVIEHVYDPVILLKECHRVLKPGGVLVVVTPNIKSMGHYMFCEHWRGLEVPRHLLLFSPQTLRACTETAGLHIEEIRTTASGATWMWAASSLLRRDGVLPGGEPMNPGLQLSLLGWVFHAVEHTLCGQLEAGEELVLKAKKQDETI